MCYKIGLNKTNNFVSGGISVGVIFIAFFDILYQLSVIYPQGRDLLRYFLVPKINYLLNFYIFSIIGQNLDLIVAL